MQSAQQAAAEEKAAAPVLNGAKKSCTSCAHAPICIIFRTFAPAHKQLFPEGTKPAFNVEDLATICTAFLSAQMAAIAQTGGAS